MGREISLLVQVIDTTQKFAGQSQERGALSLLMTATEPSLTGEPNRVATDILTTLQARSPIAAAHERTRCFSCYHAGMQCESRSIDPDVQDMLVS